MTVYSSVLAVFIRSLSNSSNKLAQSGYQFIPPWISIILEYQNMRNFFISTKEPKNHHFFRSSVGFSTKARLLLSPIKFERHTNKKKKPKKSWLAIEEPFLKHYGQASNLAVMTRLRRHSPIPLTRF